MSEYNLYIEKSKKKLEEILQNKYNNEELFLNKNNINNCSELELLRRDYEKKIGPILTEMELENNKIKTTKQNNEIGNHQLIIKMLKYSLNIGKNKLEAQFSENEDLDLFYHFLIWHYYFCKYYFVKDKKVDYLIKFINHMTNIKEKIFNDKKLKNYQKAKLLKFYSIGLEKNYTGMDAYLNTIIGYYYFDEMNDGSVLKKALEIIKYMGENLTEDSEIFFPLLLINSGIGYFKGEKTYCFNMLSPKMIREHLNELLPEIVVLYSNSKDSLYGETEKSHGIISININNTYPNLEENIQLLFKPMHEFKPYLDVQDLSNTTILFIREIYGYNKFIFEKNSFYTSPMKFFNKNDEFIEMIEFDSKKEGKQFYKCLTSLEIQSKKGESGQFIEYFFGFCKFGKILRILPLCKKVDALFEQKNWIYWVDDLKLFRIYVEYKFLGTMMELVGYEMKINSYDLNQEIDDIKKAYQIEEIKVNVDNLIKKYFEKNPFPEKTKVSDNEFEIIINYLVTSTEKGILPDYDYWGYLENKMSLKCK